MNDAEKILVSVRFSMTEDQCNALLRFNATCEDGQEYDVSRRMMKSLTYAGVIRWCGGSRFEITDAGISAVENLQDRSA